MTAYLRWMLRQLYLIVFWPSLFRREIEARVERNATVFERFRYCLRDMVAMTPAIVVLIDNCCDHTGSHRL